MAEVTEVDPLKSVSIVIKEIAQERSRLNITLVRGVIINLELSILRRICHLAGRVEILLN